MFRAMCQSQLPHQWKEQVLFPKIILLVQKRWEDNFSNTGFVFTLLWTIVICYEVLFWAPRSHIENSKPNINIDLLFHYSFSSSLLRPGLTIVRIIRNRLFVTTKQSHEKIWGNLNKIVFVGCIGLQQWQWTKNHNRR